LGDTRKKAHFTGSPLPTSEKLPRTLQNRP
jgi:hypothetical protein